MIAIACDHAGLQMKRQIMEYLKARGLEYRDFGTYTEESCDYPDFAKAAALAVASGECERGLLFCGTGVGISIAANKVRGIRCVCCSEEFSARASRRHNDTNMLAIGARVVGPDAALDIVAAWLDTGYEGGRHDKRVKKLMDIENTGAL